MAEYIDIGVNFTGSSFAHDLEDVIQRALDANVKQMIVTGTDIEHTGLAIDLCAEYPDILFATAGVHPHHASDFDDEANQKLRDFCNSDAVVAVGECGLDYNRNYSPPEAQRHAFEQQLQLACELKLPIFLHQRDAHDDFVHMISDYRKDLVNAVVHCFTDSLEEAVQYLELDMLIGVTGWICDERRGKDLQQAVREIPLDRIMIETDAPYLLPRDLAVTPVDKRRNEPCYLPHICQSVAYYMNMDTEELAAATVENTKKFFSI